MSNLSFDEYKNFFTQLFDNRLPDDEAIAFLTRLYEEGESPSAIASGAMLMRERSIKLPISDDLANIAIDNCGTGGDRSGSFNISTTVSLLLASCGSYVAKHGNRSVTSKSGSADMLEALGVNLNLEPKMQVAMLEEANFCFMFAQNHHPAMKHIMPIRKAIPHRTIFNILGPLTNPAGVSKQLIGVFEPSFVEKIALALDMLDTQKAMVVSSFDGMDEASIADKSFVASLEGKKIETFEVEPKAFNLQGNFEAIKGGDAKENARITHAILNGELEGAKKDIVLLNCALALMVDGKVEDIPSGIAMANEAIKSKRAKETLKKIVSISNRLKG